MSIQVLIFMRDHGHALDAKRLIVEAIRNGWPRASLLELADLARDLNQGKRCACGTAGQDHA